MRTLVGSFYVTYLYGLNYGMNFEQMADNVACGLGTQGLDLVSWGLLNVIA